MRDLSVLKMCKVFLLNMMIGLTLSGVGETKTIIIDNPQPLTAEIPQGWSYTVDSIENTLTFSGLSLWQMTALLYVYDASYSWVKANEFGWMDSSDSDGEFTWGWYQEDGIQTFALARSINDQLTGYIAIAGEVGDISDDYITIATNILRSIKVRDLGPGIRPVTGETLQIAGLALQRTSSGLGTSTRVNYWFCPDGSFRYDSVSLNPGVGTSSTGNLGTYIITNGVLELYFDDATRWSLAVSVGGQEVSLNNNTFEVVENDVC